MYQWERLPRSIVLWTTGIWTVGFRTTGNVSKPWWKLRIELLHAGQLWTSERLFTATAIRLWRRPRLAWVQCESEFLSEWVGLQQPSSDTASSITSSISCMASRSLFVGASLARIIHRVFIDQSRCVSPMPLTLYLFTLASH